MAHCNAVTYLVEWIHDTFSTMYPRKVNRGVAAFVTQRNRVIGKLPGTFVYSLPLPLVLSTALATGLFEPPASWS